MEEQLLKEYVSTYLNPKYNGDWDVVNLKFPELSGVDKQLLKEYVSTYLNPKYNSDWSVVNSKFPELFPAGQPTDEQSVAEQQKKNRSSVSPFVDGGSELTRFDPASGKVPEQKLPARTEFQFQPGKPLPEQIPSAKPDVKQIELETNPIVSFGKKFWETLSKQIPSSMSAKAAPTQNQFVERDIRLLKSIADVPDDELIEMPSLTDPRGGNTSTYKAGEYKKQLAEKIGKGNKATQASIELALKLNKDLSNSDVISSLTQVNDGYDLLNFISSSIGQTVAQVPLALATGGGMSYAMESGNIYLETVKEIAEKEGITPLQVIQQGKDQVALAEIGGALSGALELFGAKKILDAFGLDNIKKDIRKKALTILINSQVEGATEVGQEFISRGARGLGVEGELKAPTLTEALDSYAAGMFGAAGIQSPTLLFGSKKEGTEEIVQPVILKYGTSKYGFIRDESGNMEMTKDLDTEEQAVSMSNMLSKAYKGLQFKVEEVQSADPYIPTKYKIVASEIAPQQEAPTYKVDGKDVTVDTIDELIKTKSKDELLTMNIQINNDQSGVTERLQAILGTKPTEQDAIQKQTAGEVPVQPGATVGQEVAQGEPKAEPQGVTQEGVQEEVKIDIDGVPTEERPSLRGGITTPDGQKGYFNANTLSDGTAYIADIQIGFDENAPRGKGYGTNAYIEIGKKLKELGYNLESTQWDKHTSGISPQALRVWEKLTELGYAKVIGEKENKVYNRETGAEEVKTTPVYEFVEPTTPQGITQEGVQEEVAPTQEEIDLESQLAEDLDVIKSETKPRLRVEGIEIPAEEDIDIESIETNIDRLPAYEMNFVTPTFSQDIQVNPLEESKSQVKEGTAETRPIESFEGVPMVVGMSDTLAAGTVVDSMGNPMEVEGGLLYNVLGKNKNAAWAGVTQKGAQTQYNEALELYKNNKNLFEKLWAEGKLPNGHVPMAIMKMADTAVNSNEAVFRYLSPLVKSQSDTNQQAALNALKGDIEVKKKVKQKATVKSANKLDQFISSNNINSLGQLLDAIITDSNSRAKGDTKNTLSLTERSLLFDLMISPQGTKEASKNTVNALFGSKKDPKSKAFLADTIYNDISEPSMMKTPKGNIVSVVGIDVLNGGVIPVEHGNYGFGPKGQMIALISNPKHGLDVFPEWKAKATRVFKKSKGGVMPSDQKIADEVGGAFYIDKAFRGAQVSMEPTDVELLSAKLRFAFPDVTVSNSQEEFDRVLQEEGVRTKEANGKVILGMTKDGKIYLNPDSDSLATPIHEFGHIWIDFLRSKASGKKGDALLSKGLSLVEGTTALQQAIAKYGDNALAREEALVELMATKGETIINKSKQKQFKNWLNALFKYVKEFFTTSEKFFKGTDFEQKLNKITLDDFINIGLADLLKGKEVSSKFKAKQAAAAPKARSSKAQRLAPNGKPSNLSEAQWNQVRTPEFKKWFGDWENDPENASKVVDENGEPLVMYHGSPSVDIESFDIDKSVRQKSGLREFANYFTSNKKLADLYRKSPLSKEYKNEIENLLREAKEKRSESRNNAAWNFYTQEIDRLNSLFEGKIYEVFLNVKSPFEFNGGDLDMKGWDNASLDIGYKTVSGKAGVIEALSGNNSAYRNTEYDGLIATNLADMFYGTTNKNETIQAVKDLTGTVVAIWDAKQIKSATENVGTFDTGTPNIRFRVGDNVQSFINKARAQGYSETAIKNVLTRSGVDTDAIDTALAKVEPAAKKVEVTEEFAPGYNRMITELEGVVEKSLKRGTTQARAMENAINYLRGTKVYENATDVQREQMERDVNKRFKKRQKAAPSAEKVVGKPKKKEVTVDEMAALKDQIKLEARAAREAKGDLNDKRKALAAKVSALKGKGTVTVNQLDTIVKRIERTNLDNPIMVDRLLAYIEKVFDNANYAADMDELRKLQKQARSRNHASMTNVVKQFTSINPENIPLDRIQEYKKALDFLNNLTPSYATMNEILDEMLSYQVTEEFDAVKTLEALEKKYKSIQLNEVGSVEEYRNLIKDINSFKRKAFQLLQNEEITQEQYDDLIKMVGEDQQTIEENYKDEITKIKKDLIAEIKNQRPKVSRDFSNVENDLIRKYLELSDADLESLSPEELFILNDLLENISNGEIDVSRFGPIVSKAYTSSGLDPLAKQINKSKFDKSSEEGRQALSEQESSFWEGLLGMGRAKVGALQKLIISPFNRAISSYEKLNREAYNEFLRLKNKYKIDKFDPLKNSKDMHKIGMLTTYLQEHMAQFDSKNKDVKDIGKRDWFKEILNSRAMRDNYSSGKPSVFKSIGLGKSELDIIKEIWDNLPKNKDGNVDPKAVYDSYMANDGKFFTKNQKAFFDDVMAYKAAEITPKQKFANELSGASFKEIPFHMMRVRLDKGKSQIAPTASSENNNVRISAGTGKERVSEKVGAVMTNFEKLFISGIEQTGRDYFLSNALQDINNTLAGVKKIVGDEKIELINTISYTLSDALKFEFDRVKTNFIFRNLLSARAAQTLLRPIRTAVELGSTLISYPVRAKTLSGYKSLFGEQGAMKKLLEFTDSPMLLRNNISKAIDINDGSIEPQSAFTKATNYLSGLPERTMMVTSWMPTFKSEFKNITGIDFDMNKFNNSEAYREKYGKVIRESSAAADAQTEKIIGPTTKAGQRREVRIAPKFLANLVGSEGTVSKNTAEGQILGFFSNYPFRESTEFLNGFREAAEVLNDQGALSSLSQLQKPLGVALNVAAYSFLSSATYALGLMLLGDDEDEKRGEDLLKALLTGEGLLEELKSNAISLAGSQYAAGGKAIIQLAVTILIESTDDEKLKAKYKKLLKDSVFIDPLPVDKALGFKGEQEVAGAIGKYIPQFGVAYARFADLIGTKNEIKAIYDKVESKGVNALTEDEGLKILALNTLFNGTQIVLNLFGTSLPEYNNIKTYMKKLKEDAGVAEVYKGEVPTKKKKSSGGGGSSRGGGMNKTDMKKYNRELYDQMYGPGSAGYEIEQEVKAFEKEQREYKNRIKDQVYGGKD